MEEIRNFQGIWLLNLLWTSFSFHFPSSPFLFALFSPSPGAASPSSSVLYGQQCWGFGVLYWERIRLFSGTKSSLFSIKIRCTNWYINWPSKLALALKGFFSVKTEGKRIWPVVQHLFFFLNKNTSEREEMCNKPEDMIMSRMNMFSGYTGPAVWLS